MLKPDMIPDEVVEAAARAAWKLKDQRLWEILKTTQPNWRDEAREALAAALQAWPGMQHKPYWDFRTHEKHTELILPVPQKEKGGQ